ncbi:hypothetical protein [Caenispirillum bisanense]|uniref:Uncharacterized protein n=1 Tax=Caenispirillum bisanense TaxID=414052 RepID=A0A286G172_9PROT|nr:hypothetical protein [Caenispirillum bisanense]SOD88919.1 hypothetical protein SAMN05421508_10149 [Caenispirillum bisanense]
MVSPERVPGRGDYEHRDAAPRGVVYAAVAFVVTLSLFGVVAVVLDGLLEPDRPAPPPITGRLERGGPPLNVEPEDTLADARRRHRARLEGTAWVDRDAGIARIPIDTALRLTAERGWQEPPPDAPPTVQTPVPQERVPLKDRPEEEPPQ